jgi:hypothetical protein
MAMHELKVSAGSLLPYTLMRILACSGYSPGDYGFIKICLKRLYLKLY